MPGEMHSASIVTNSAAIQSNFRKPPVKLFLEISYNKQNICTINFTFSIFCNTSIFSYLIYVRTMSVEKAYDTWAIQYDSNQNKTRDLEAIALQETVGNIEVEHCLEIGCGTGKNTSFLLTKARAITAIDLSQEMLAKAKEKVRSAQVQFIQADITGEWSFANVSYDLVSFSLVLEHLENLLPVFEKTSAVLKSGGYVYVGELHPFKQYSGSKARFDTEEGRQIVQCYTHHVSDFVQAAQQYGLKVVGINEYFDDNHRHEIPRILTLLFRKE
jgi:ubiquinone/menaquinone biosynthesis C-methylase UbiE